MGRITPSLIIIKYSHLHWQNGCHQMWKTVSHNICFFSMGILMRILFTLLWRTLFFKIKCQYAQFYWHIYSHKILLVNFSTERSFRLSVTHRHWGQQDHIAAALSFISGSAVLWQTTSPAHVCYVFYTFSQCICWKWNCFLLDLKNNCHSSLPWDF